MRVERWGGKPDGWWVTGAPCGHNHGVVPTRLHLWIEIMLCILKPWGWER